LADWASRYGAPIALTSYRGANFLARVIEQFCKIWDIHQSFTSSYHPQANGRVERLNGTICDMIRAYAIETGRTWDETLGAILFAYRNAMHSSAQASPALLLYGKILRSPLDAELDLHLHQFRRTFDPDFVFQHAEALARARDQARQRMGRFAETSA
jgi:hypothetical protein